MISALDGRYRRMLTDIPNGDSRLKFQLEIIYKWAHHVLKCLDRTPTPDKIIDFVFNDEIREKFNAYELQCGHDVKAMQYTIMDCFFDQSTRYIVHFGLTSEDVNSFGNCHLMIESTVLIKKELGELINLIRLVGDKLHYRIVARTHGQPAVATSYLRRFNTEANLFENLMLKLTTPSNVKFGGPIGTFDEARKVIDILSKKNTIPNISFDQIVNSFEPFSPGEFIREEDTFQTSFYHNHAKHFNDISVICSVLSKFMGDVWDGFSRGHFILKTSDKRIGSSVMPNKYNPANTENAMGNLKLSQGLFNTLSINLPLFRLERDIADSTMLRNMPTAYAHFILAIRMFKKDLLELEPSDELKSESEIEKNGGIYAAVLQLFLSIRDLDETSYDKLKKFTSNELISKKKLYRIMKKNFFADNEIGDLNTLMDVPFKKIYFNTSNLNKQKELTIFFNMFGFDVEYTQEDIVEPIATHNEVISYKATKLGINGPILCEDSALFIEGSDQNGIEIKYFMNNLDMYAGKAATFVVLIGIYDYVNDQVKIFEGKVDGMIVKNTSTSAEIFGFDANFIPNGSNRSYAEFKPLHLNARYLAIEKYFKQQYSWVDPIKNWTGLMQS